MEKLKPCPFCGGKSFCFAEEQTTVMSEPYVRAIVRCTNCEARIQRIKDGYVPEIAVKNMVIEAWNRRTTTKAVMQHKEESGILDELPMYQQPVGWIPVTERLPEEYIGVLCYCSRSGQYGCGEWSKQDNGTIYWIGLNGMIPTHWMPLPSAEGLNET